MEKEEFIKKLKQSNRIKDAHEAFKEFPAEEEWHKGDEKSFLKEETEIYGEYNKGDIVFVKEYKYKKNDIRPYWKYRTFYVRISMITAHVVT